MSLRLLRGRVVVREAPMSSSILVLPNPKQDAVKTHRGRVLGIGEIPERLAHYRVDVGDEVIFHFEQLYDWGDIVWLDGEKATTIPLQCVDAVLEP